MKDLQEKLLATFQVEHREHVEQIRSLLALMANTTPLREPAGPELEEIFRRAHSLKGAARAVDLRPVEQLAHRLETLFSRVRQGACAFDAQVERVTQQVLDATEDCMALREGAPQAESIGAAMRAIGGILGIDDSPPGPAATASAIPSAPVQSFQPLETLRVSADSFDGLFRTAGGITGEIGRQDVVARDLAGLTRNIARVERSSAEAARAALLCKRRAGPAADSGLSALLVSIGVMERETRAVGRYARSATLAHRRARWSLGQLGRQLQSDVRQARMAPAENLLDGYRRMMRDLARGEGKEIRFQTFCASVQADRRVLDALKDPIMHLLRNAVSHGIESAAVRLQKGKKPEGVVTLRIDADGQRLIVTVEDDGGGVDLFRVAEIVAREGLATRETTEDKNRELTRVLFRAGFTTAATVTSLSGRGMGLSVVDETVRRLHGEVDVEPRPGKGARVTLAVPLSIASHRLIVVRCGTGVFALPMPGIESVRRMAGALVSLAVGPSGRRPVVVIDGETVPLAGIAELLGTELAGHPAIQPPTQRPAQPPTKTARQRHVLVLRSGGNRIAVAVDEILREADAAVQDLAWAGGGAGLISSAAVLDDGAIALVLNPVELVRRALDSRPRPEAFEEWEQPAAAAPLSSILVVDDSMTTRALEKSILEAHGYKVRVAVDGVEALARLREEAADLVISDIEMPRLDGFALIETMKRDPALERIPVIVVSSVERREDRERGLAAGADAYIVKRGFDQEELLGVIRQIV
jgi:two-component system chemotaxis sensor kinase CheA